MMPTPRHREIIARANEAGYFPMTDDAAEIERIAAARIREGSDGVVIVKIVQRATEQVILQVVKD